MLAKALGLFIPVVLASLTIAQAPETGAWRAVLETRGGELPFGLELQEQGGKYVATFVNGAERLEVPYVQWADGALTIRVEPYDSRIVATPSANGRELAGEWLKGSGGRVSSLPFRATHGAQNRFASGPAEAAASRVEGSVDGRWSVLFGRNPQPAVGIFNVHDDGTATGTFLTTTGDYRFLAGDAAGGKLNLSCFDGSHAFLFKARLLEDGTMEGQFWSSGGRPQAWTAKRDPNVTLPEAFDLTKWNQGVDLAALSYPDLEGKPRSLEDPAFAGKARLLVVFGTWCPNCNDEAPYLVELDQRYRARGLSILGLAFEHSGEHDKDASRVRAFMERHGAEYPILIAGSSNKSRASEAFPALDRVRSFPTTIFMDSAGKVRAVHQGYTGPATGETHVEMRRRFEGLIEELLAEGR